jgi:hypothetical protein
MGRVPYYPTESLGVWAKADCCAGAPPPIAARPREPCSANDLAPARWQARPGPVSGTLAFILITQTGATPPAARQRAVCGHVLPLMRAVAGELAAAALSSLR